MNKNILITGCSSGLGLALSNFYLENNFTVYGISRTKPNIKNKNFHFKEFDLSDLSRIKPELTSFIDNIKEIETVYLNAGMLGDIKEITKLSITEIKEVLDLNVFANKELLDILSANNVKSIIGISSGASKTVQRVGGVHIHYQNHH